MIRFLRDLKIRQKLFTIVIISVAGFVVFDYLGYHTLDFLKVNGPLYQRIIQGKDTIADVLPPPKYIIESYLIAHHMLIEKHPEDMEKLFQDSYRLEKEYIERQQFWSEHLPEGELKNELVRLSHQPAMEFFRLRNEEFFPLIINGETEKARELLDDRLEPLYDEHRKAIDRVVAIAKGMNAADERLAKKIVYERGSLLIIWGIIVVAAGILLSLYLVNRITIPLSRITRAAKKISEGDLSQAALAISSKDEIGSLSKAIEEMRIALQRTVNGLQQKLIEYKEAQEELMAARSHLEARVKERTQELEEANQAIHRLNVELEGRINERTALFEAANRELQEANAMNQLLLGAIPFGMDIIDEEGIIQAVNPRMEHMYGKDIIGKKCWEVFRDDHKQCPDCPLGKGITPGEITTVESSGVFGGKIFLITLCGMFYQGKKAVLEIFQDITERKRQEQELREAHQRLTDAQGQLVQSAKMASIGQLAGGVAHEINNPLTGVLNNVQLIKLLAKQKDDFTPAKFITILDAIEESALRCASITHSLLDFSYSGKMRFRSLSLNEPAEKVLSLIGNELRLENITIEKQLQSDLPYVLGDLQLLQQVVFDILTNARWAILKKSPNEGGIITIKTWYEPQGNKVFLSISDTGIGISEENLRKVFDPFFTTKPVGEGTGLGLSIVYSIIKQHNGSITAESQPGKGAAFIASLPVTEAKDTDAG